MNKELLQKLVNKGLSCGADFSEIFYENTITKSYNLTNSKIEKINFSHINGVGIRLRLGENTRYAHTNDLTENNILSVIDSLGNSKKKNHNIVLLDDLKQYKVPRKIEHNEYSDDMKKEFLYKIDSLVRSKSDKIVQVQAVLWELDQKVTIANSFGKHVSDDRILTRINIFVTGKKGDISASAHELFGLSKGYEIIEEMNLEEVTSSLVEAVLNKLDATECPGGNMPVIIGPAFGSVIFHEACGHAMESTTVSKGISVLSNKLNEKIGSDKLNIIDDGTLSGEWGTINIDDEGNFTKQNKLIENGILKGYLIDYFDGKKMNMESTGSCRRQDYSYIPVSRMNNTYLLPGKDKIEDMFKSIEYGLYAKRMNGGSVDPVTGDFNFGVNEAYMIRNGKICECVKGVSLIGNALDILKQVEMVSEDLSFGSGFCGADSGSIPVSCGQPTIKISNILVGGNK